MKTRYSLLILALCLLLVSCGVNNTMYNARKYFKAAQERPLTANGRPSNQAVEEYTKTIQKCGIIITERPNSRNLDDVVFLLARALYYKANSAFQAKDQFEALIKGFPNSKHYPEAHIYLARTLRQINRPAESEAVLEGFVRDGRYRKHHPRALLVLAEFEIEDKDYIRTQYWLQRIINDYSDTPEFKEAFFLFGKNFYEQKDYASSLKQFEKFIKTRGITKEQKMDARYYIALNHFELGELGKSSREVTSLLRDESRPEKVGQIRVLKARILLASKNPGQGVEEVGEIYKVYPRTESSSSAYYYLGDYYFYRDQNIAEAITNYNKVRADYPASTLVPISQEKVAALNQIKENQNLSLTGNLQQYVDYHLLAAENYLNTFALPDSALLMYDRILDAPQEVMAEMDSLNAEIGTLETKVDSLQMEINSLAPEEPQVPAVTEPTQTTEEAEDSPADDETEEVEEPELEEVEETEVPAVAEPTQITEEIEEPKDDIVTEDREVEEPKGDERKEEEEKPKEGEEPKPDEGKEDEEEDKPAEPKEPEDPRRNLQSELQRAQTSIASLDTKIKECEGILLRLENEFLPQVYFTKANLLKKLGDHDDALQAIQDTMQIAYPDNKYTNALGMLIADEPVRLIDPEEDRQTELLDRALGFGTAEPDSMRVLLEQLVDSSYPHLALRANFRLGWMYSFEVVDTTLAKPYLDAVLEHPQGGEYAAWVQRFYNGTNYFFPEEPKEETEDSEELPEADEIRAEESPEAEDTTGEGEIEEPDTEEVEGVESPKVPAVDEPPQTTGEVSTEAEVEQPVVDEEEPEPEEVDEPAVDEESEAEPEEIENPAEDEVEVEPEPEPEEVDEPVDEVEDEAESTDLPEDKTQATEEPEKPKPTEDTDDEEEAPKSPSTQP